MSKWLLLARGGGGRGHSLPHAVSSLLSLFYAPSAPPAHHPALSHPHFHCFMLQVPRPPNVQRCLILTFIVWPSKCTACPTSSAVYPHFHCFMLQVPRPPIIQRCLILTFIVWRSKCTARPTSSAVSSSISLFYAPSAPPARHPALSHPQSHCLTLQVHRPPNIQPLVPDAALQLVHDQRYYDGYNIYIDCNGTDAVLHNQRYYKGSVNTMVQMQPCTLRGNTMVMIFTMITMVQMQSCTIIGTTRVQ